MTPLRERMQHDMLIRNLAENTQRSYLQQVSSFAGISAARLNYLAPRRSGPGSSIFVKSASWHPAASVQRSVPCGSSIA